MGLKTQRHRDLVYLYFGRNRAVKFAVFWNYWLS